MSNRSKQRAKARANRPSGMKCDVGMTLQIHCAKWFERADFRKAIDSDAMLATWRSNSRNAVTAIKLLALFLVVDASGGEFECGDFGSLPPDIEREIADLWLDNGGHGKWGVVWLCDSTVE